MVGNPFDSEIKNIEMAIVTNFLFEITGEKIMLPDLKYALPELQYEISE